MGQQNIKKILSEIPKNIAVVAASKTRTASEIKEAMDAGITIIGENYVQEAEKKYNTLKGKVKFHCIGHLQKNKVKKAVEIFDMIQTVDSVDIAKEIDKRCKAISKVMPIFIEVNIGEEENKAGAMPEDVLKIIKDISDLKNIRVQGLMAMGPNLEDKEEMRPYFKAMHFLFQKIKEENIKNVEMKFLSIGMSSDYKIAIEEGSNMVRLGTVLFGERES